MSSKGTQQEIHFSYQDVVEGFYRLIKLPNIYQKRCFCFFIDGLDEYEGTPYEDTKFMVKRLQEWTAIAPDGVKMCVSSREYNVFMNHLYTEQSFRLQALTRRDMYEYIKERLDEIEDGKRKRDIIDTIITKANGIFLWVAVVVRSLREYLEDSYDLEALEKEIDAYPEELNALFKYGLMLIGKNARAKVFQISAMVDRLKAYALNLSLFSISFLENFEGDPEFAMRESFPFSGLNAETIEARLGQMRKRLNGYCKGLLETSRGKTPTSNLAPIISYTHRSVPEFLQSWKQDAGQELNLDTFDVENTISQLSIAEIRAAFSPKLEASRFLGRLISAIIDMRSQRALDRAPFAFLDYLEHVLPSRHQFFQQLMFHYGSLGEGEAIWWIHGSGTQGFVTSPLLILAHRGQIEYPIWKVQTDFQSLSSNNDKLVSLLGWAMYGAGYMKEENAAVAIDIVPQIYGELLGQGMSPQTMLRNVRWTAEHTESGLTFWELYITSCFRLSLPRRASLSGFQGLGSTLQYFLEHGADPDLAIYGLGRSDKDCRIEFRYKTRNGVCCLESRRDSMELSERELDLVFETGKGREIQLDELIRFWNFENTAAILQLMNKSTPRTELGTVESDEVEKVSTQSQHLGTSKLAIPWKWVNVVRQSLQLAHVMTFLLGKSTNY